MNFNRSMRVLTCVVVALVMITSGVRASEENDFFEAIRTNNVEEVKALLAKKPDLVASKSEVSEGSLTNWRPIKWTPLHSAVAEHRNPQIAAILLAHGADTNAVDENGRTPLHIASQVRNVTSNSPEPEKDFFVQLLIQFGANTGLRDKKGRLPIHEAALAGRATRVELFNRHKNYSIEAEDNSGMTILDAAVVSVDGNTVDTVLRLGAKPNILSAVFKGDVEVVRTMLRANPRVANSKAPRGGYQITPLSYAVGANNLKIATMLLSRGANPNPDAFDTPLGTAVRNNNKAMVRLLLKHGAKVNAPIPANYNASALAIARSDEITKLLRQHSAMPATGKKKK